MMEKRPVEMVFIIDRSGSMAGLEEDTIGGFNTMLREQQRLDGKAVVTTVLFDDRYELLHDQIDIQDVAPLTKEDYTVRGSTALLDAIGMTIHKIRKAQRSTTEELRPKKTMLIIITDGQENASRHYTVDMIRERIGRQKNECGWEFAFFGANMDAIMEAGKLGIAADRAQNYHADAAGTHSAYAAMSALSTAFRTEGLQEKKQEDGVLSAEAAVEGVKKAIGGLKAAADEMLDEFSALVQMAKANGGAVPDVNKIAKKVLEEARMGEGK